MFAADVQEESFFNYAGVRRAKPRAPENARMCGHKIRKFHEDETAGPISRNRAKATRREPLPCHINSMEILVHSFGFREASDEMDDMRLKSSPASELRMIHRKQRGSGVLCHGNRTSSSVADNVFNTNIISFVKPPTMFLSMLIPLTLLWGSRGRMGSEGEGRLMGEELLLHPALLRP